MGAVKNEQGIYEPIYPCQDETGDWYIIPISLKDIFNAYTPEALENDYDLQDEFEEKFGKYRTGSCITSKQLYIKKDETGE